MSKWLGYTVELFFDGQWYNIDQWHRHANGQLRALLSCILRRNEIFSLAHMMSWLLVERESAFLTWQQKPKISSVQKIQLSNAVHSTHGIFSFGATSLTWRCYFKSLLRMKTMDTFQRIYSKGCLSGFKTKSRFFDRPSRTS